MGLNFASLYRHWWHFHKWSILERNINKKIRYTCMHMACIRTDTLCLPRCTGKLTNTSVFLSHFVFQNQIPYSMFTYSCWYIFPFTIWILWYIVFHDPTTHSLQNMKPRFLIDEWFMVKVITCIYLSLTSNEICIESFAFR